MKRWFWIGAISVFLMPTTIAAGVGISLNTVTYAIEKDIAPDRLDDVMIMTLLDSGWLPVEVSAGHIIAETTIGLKHYVKIDLKYDIKSVVIIPLIIGKSINFGRPKAPKVHPNYYKWLEQLIARLPIAAAKIELIRSLNDSP